jgi:hypothetical protein
MGDHFFSPRVFADPAAAAQNDVLWRRGRSAAARLGRCRHHWTVPGSSATAGSYQGIDEISAASPADETAPQARSACIGGTSLPVTAP